MRRAAESTGLSLTFVEESESWDVGTVPLPEHQQLILPSQNLNMIVAVEQIVCRR